ncbi:acyl carrier protein [Sporofaciens musculi]|uniref:acyl carrier protein n=1 Tax=Sporofaciens musculi TaxID=2681861 RepID=UPI002172570B|nr:acyl carrier protein [Sporofaciens musculi]MCI9421892.1 acyl carrier protein [Dorea sp.]
MENFIELAADIFEMEPSEISAEMDFREEIEEWSSLMGFSLIVMMEDEYGVKVSVEEFLQCKTIEDLYNRCNKG